MELTKGGNVVLGPIGDGAIPSLVLGLTWDSGSLECDVCALVCGPERKVLSDDHFLFWSNLASPDRTVFLRSQSEPHDGSKDRAQVLIDLVNLSPMAETIVVTLSTLVDGANLNSLKRLRIRALDPTTGAELVSYEVGGEVTIETCLIVGEVYQHKDNWKFRAVGQGYHTGLAGLGSDYGVNIV